MSELIVLSEKDIHKLLTMSMAIKGVEQAYIQKASGRGELFPMVFHEFEPGKADMDIKSGVLKESGIYGLKLVSWFGGNVSQGLPALYGTTLIFDESTGAPIALLNAAGVTGMRTGAAGAIGAKYLARRDSENMLMVGTGEQAPYQIAAMLVAVPTIKNIILYNPHGAKKAYDRLLELTESIASILSMDNSERKYQFTVMDSLQAAVGISDIIVTATPSRKPMILKEWLKTGTHISCIGADMEGKQELESTIVADSRVFVDDMAQALSVGECEISVKEGLFSEDRIIGELGSVILGTVEGRLCAQDITVFDSTGIALQDLIVSKEIIDLARVKGIGSRVEL